MLTAEAPAPLDTKRWVGQRFTCSVESGVRVHRPGACVTATTASGYASRDCRHDDPCHMTPGRVVRHHCRHDTSRCRTTPPLYDTSRGVGRHHCCTTPGVRHTTPPSYDTSRCRTTLPSYDTSRCRTTRRRTTPRVRHTTLPSYDTSGPSCDTTVVRHLQVSYDATVVRHLQVSYGGLPNPVMMTETASRVNYTLIR